jgi:hypothetical protein
MVDEYEILPHQVLQDLKTEVESLKTKLTQPDAKANELILEIESMKDSIHELNEVFLKALEHAKGHEIGNTLTGLRDKVEMVTNQNETIARALVAISDKIDSLGTRPAPVQHSMGPPSMGSRVAPPMGAPTPMPAPPRGMPSPPSGIPPPPPKRKGLFK